MEIYIIHMETINIIVLAIPYAIMRATPLVNAGAARTGATTKYMGMTDTSSTHNIETRLHEENVAMHPKVETISNICSRKSLSLVKRHIKNAAINTVTFSNDS
ncbi:hypothetical protein FACS189472_08120 [Alphaproteobacteria bacterium]|nr:hypothetical protein FACS189472_08120 [Alphaproteobacteria bacterium]